jgi:site-specific recombinase XerD
MHRELTDFLAYCRIERRLAPITRSAYERDVGTCIAFLEREGIVTVGEVRPGDLRRFLAEESIRRPSPSSQARTVAALKCFFRFLLEDEQIERNPALMLRTPKKREALPDVLDRRELGRPDLARPGSMKAILTPSRRALSTSADQELPWVAGSRANRIAPRTCRHGSGSRSFLIARM